MRRERLVSDFLQFCLLLGGELYHFTFNLPLILGALLTRSPLSPLPAPQLKHLQAGLIKMVMLLDLLALNLVNLVEYHLLLCPALLVLAALGDEARLEAVRARLDQFLTEAEEENNTVSELLEDLIEKVVLSQGAVREDQDNINKLELSGVGSPHESGYLSEIDLDQ